MYTRLQKEPFVTNPDAQTTSVIVKKKTLLIYRDDLDSFNLLSSSPFTGASAPVPPLVISFIVFAE